LTPRHRRHLRTAASGHPAGRAGPLHPGSRTRERILNTNLLDSFRHNSWATSQLLEFCRPLPDERLTTRGLGIFGDILETLHHIIGVDGSSPLRFVNSSIDPARLLEEQLAKASPDLLRELLTTFVNTLMSAGADSVCGAAYATTSPDRVNRRNGYRAREFDTHAGTLDLAVPKLRQSTYFPEWLLERRKRAERALTSVVATC